MAQKVVFDKSGEDEDDIDTEVPHDIFTGIELLMSAFPFFYAPM